MIHRLVPAVRERGFGWVVTIGGGPRAAADEHPPAVQRHAGARHNLAVSLARDLTGTGVTYNVVSPGAILVDAVQDLVTEIGPAGWGD